MAIKAPNIKTKAFVIVGNAPYVSNKFSAEAREMMRKQQAQGSRAKKGSKREPKDFDKLCKQSTHYLPDGSPGIPASCFRQALISACRLVGFKMTLAKLSIFVEADGFDADPGERTPLVRIQGEPKHFEMAVRNESGVADIRARHLWEPGWKATLRIKYDADQFDESDVRNLLMRVGSQVGIGAGRPDSKESSGQGWGTFDVASE